MMITSKLITITRIGPVGLAVNFRNLLILIVGFFCFILTNQPAFAQQSNLTDSSSGSQIEVMFLGTFHFHHAPDYYDIKEADHQEELKKVLDSLSEFRPTKIALEASYHDSAKFDSLYKSYLDGEHILSSNERQQLGFRLAERLNHNELYCVDYKQAWPYQEVMSWAKENVPEFINFYQNWKENINSYEEQFYREATLTEHLQWLNSKSYRDRLKNLRMRRLELGAGSNFVGVKPISSSYERNLKIFANITKYAKPGDRIIVIFGASHGYFLREFVQMHPDMKLIEVSNYL